MKHKGSVVLGLTCALWLSVFVESGFQPHAKGIPTPYGPLVIMNDSPAVEFGEKLGLSINTPTSPPLASIVQILQTDYETVYGKAELPLSSQGPIEAVYCIVSGTQSDMLAGLPQLIDPAFPAVDPLFLNEMPTLNHVTVWALTFHGFAHILPGYPVHSWPFHVPGTRNPWLERPTSYYVDANTGRIIWLLPTSFPST